MDHLLKRLRDGIAEHPKRWTGDGGRPDEAATEATMAEAADQIEALLARAEAAEAERDRLRKVLDVDPWKVGFAHWKALRARAALTDAQEGRDI